MQSCVAVLAAAAIALAVCVAASDNNSNPAYPAIAGLPLEFEQLMTTCISSGTIPEWLTGTVFRNGPANYQNASEQHWFAGWAMIHAFAFAGDGFTVTYTAQYVGSTDYNHTVIQNRKAAEANTDPCRRLFGAAMTTHAAAEEVTVDPYSPNTLVTIRRVVDSTTGTTHYLSNTALIESNEFDPVTLNTNSAPYPYADADTFNYPIAALVPEHAQTDPAGNIYHWFTSFGGGGLAAGYYPYTVAAGSNKRVQLTNGVPVGVGALGVPTYQHSFGLSANYMIMSEVPCTFGQSGFSSYTFYDIPVVWRVLSRTTGEQMYTFTSPPFFMFHHTNAWEDATSNSIVVELLAYPDASLLDLFYLDVLQSNSSAMVEAASLGRLVRYTLPLSNPGATVAPQVMNDRGFELPTINPTYHSVKAHRYVYGAGFVDPKSSAFIDCIVKTDTQTGTSVVYGGTGPNTIYPGEPIFVPTPAANGGTGAEDDGVLLSVVYDPVIASSALVIIDAQTLVEIGRAQAPNMVPLGFHGRYYHL